MNPVITCTRRIQFCAGHRVHLHESKCANPHGHNYVVFLRAQAPALDGLGRVIDFGVLKERLGGWIDRMWDHGFLYFQFDHAMREMLALMPSARTFPFPYNPTAENIARYLLDVVAPQVLAGTGVTVDEVTVWETENCMATARLGEHRGMTLADAETWLREERLGA